MTSHHMVRLDLHTDHRLRLTKEMYLKAILQLSQEGNEVRPVDLVNCLGITKGSVSEMLKNLEGDGFLHYQSFKTIKLTPKGTLKAQLVLRKYHIIHSFLEKVLHMKGAKGHDQACNLEHVFSDDAILRLERFLKERQ
ncbi:MAG TPA: metal-dependent transcriptional regulator [Candidatus Nanoarchaeia archaeon]|nr:metal-dependent transcriptional regulator [Candidatus Nanoarchaeia archaeon]